MRPGLKRRPVLIGLAGLGSAWAAGHLLAFPRPWSGDGMSAYAMALIRLALGADAARFELVPTEQPDMVQSHTLEALGRGQGAMKLLWSVTDRWRESVCEPIRIPMDRGLLGWRIPLIRQEDVPRWARMQQAEEARRLVAGQGSDWPDTAILRANGFKVETSSRYATLFGMLAHGRFDQMPRSVLEIENEARAHAAQGLVIAPRVLLVYPAANYFFVSRSEPEFATLLRAGLERLARNGDLAKLFRQHFDPALAALGVAQRLVLRLNNPLLPPRTPLARAELWEQP
jgi:hypothetical protein